jgi:hypothetical protein
LEFCGVEVYVVVVVEGLVKWYPIDQIDSEAVKEVDHVVVVSLDVERFQCGGLVVVEEEIEISVAVAIVGVFDC